MSSYSNEPLGHKVLSHQIQNLKDVWNNTGDAKSKAIGTERLLKMFLIIVQFITPSIYIRAFFGRYGNLAKNLGIELYVIFKLLCAFCILFFGLYNNLKIIWGYSFFMCWAFFMILETVLYSANLIINNNVFTNPISYKRNLIFVILDYIELNLDFATVYLSLKALKKIVSNNDVLITKPLDSLYFSFISSLTIGYGDITPLNDTGKYLIIFQVLVFLLLGALVINFYSAQIASEKEGRKSDSKGNSRSIVRPGMHSWLCLFKRFRKGISR
ncbi:MAG: potassium channel family protein [Ignavibacteriaceae bacterium]|jgi:hypothetical protein|nr:potassium channel family protein [Ignavibacteriaceae bacterium]